MSAGSIECGCRTPRISAFTGSADPWISPGNTPDVTAIARIKDDLRGMRWGRALFVGDAGTGLAANLKDHSKGACRLVASKRYGRYLSLDDKGRPYLDKDKVKRAGHLDGKFALTTNDDTLSVADIARACGSSRAALGR